MKKEVADRWIEALRSGKYKQTMFNLKNDDRFCCLGVLCDISGQGEWDGYDNYIHRKHFLPKEVIKWAQINSELGKIEGKSSLSELNDHGYSFNYIANIIEEHWKEL